MVSNLFIMAITVIECYRTEEGLLLDNLEEYY